MRRVQRVGQELRQPRGDVVQPRQRLRRDEDAGAREAVDVPDVVGVRVREHDRLDVVGPHAMARQEGLDRAVGHGRPHHEPALADPAAQEAVERVEVVHPAVHQARGGPRTPAAARGSRTTPRASKPACSRTCSPGHVLRRVVQQAHRPRRRHRAPGASTSRSAPRFACSTPRAWMRRQPRAGGTGGVHAARRRSSSAGSTSRSRLPAARRRARSRRRRAPAPAARRPRPRGRSAGRSCRTRCRSSGRRRPAPCRARPPPRAAAAGAGAGLGHPGGRRARRCAARARPPAPTSSAGSSMRAARSAGESNTRARSAVAQQRGRRPRRASSRRRRAPGAAHDGERRRAAPRVVEAADHPLPVAGRRCRVGDRAERGAGDGAGVELQDGPQDARAGPARRRRDGGPPGSPCRWASRRRAPAPRAPRAPNRPARAATPARRAMASRCTMAFVEPPMAASTTSALWNAPAVEHVGGAHGVDGEPRGQPPGPLPVRQPLARRRRRGGGARRRHAERLGQDGHRRGRAHDHARAGGGAERALDRGDVAGAERAGAVLGPVARGSPCTRRCAGRATPRPASGPTPPAPPARPRRPPPSGARARSCRSLPPARPRRAAGTADCSSSVIAARLRKSIAVGESRGSPSAMVGKTIGRAPPAATPRAMARTSSGICRWHGT